MVKAASVARDRGFVYFRRREAPPLSRLRAMGEAEEQVPALSFIESGAVFTFGKCKFAENVPSKFWFKNDKPLHISCGDEHTSVVTENGKLYMFGSNNWGQLGFGSKNAVNKPTCVKALKPEKVKLAACGRNHTLICTEQGNVYAAGGNSEGQLGLGDTEERSTFHLISFFTKQHKIKQLAAGSYTSAVLTEDGQLVMWGDNSEGQIGLGDKAYVSVPHQVDIGKPVSCISCGYYHSALITQDGELYTFGEPENGKLGLSPKQLKNHKLPQLVSGISGKVSKVACGGGHTVVLAEGDVYTFGLGQYGQLGHGTFVFETSEPKTVDHLGKHKICHIACGENHTALITENGLMYTFGDGRHGKLGLGEENYTNQFVPTLCSNFLRFIVHSVACGGCHMLVFASPRHKESDKRHTTDQNEHSLSKIFTEIGEDTLEIETFHRTLSARVRRREKEKSPEQFNRLVRTLPPLGESFLKPASNGISATVPLGISRANHSESQTAEREKEAESAFDYETGDKKEENSGTDESSTEDDSDENEGRTLGDTTDVLNMTHVMRLNPSDQTLELAPIQKDKKKNKNAKVNIDGKGGLKKSDLSQVQKGLKSDETSSEVEPTHSECLGEDHTTEKSSYDAFVRKIKAGKNYTKTKSEQSIAVSAMKCDTQQTLIKEFKGMKRKEVGEINSRLTQQEIPLSLSRDDRTDTLFVDHQEEKAKAKAMKPDKCGTIYVEATESKKQQSELKHKEKIMKQIAVTVSSSSSEETSNGSAKYVLQINQYNYENMSQSEMKIKNRNIQQDEKQYAYKKRGHFEDTSEQEEIDKRMNIEEKSDKDVQTEDNMESKEGSEKSEMVVEEAEGEEQDEKVSEKESEGDGGENVISENHKEDVIVAMDRDEEDQLQSDAENRAKLEDGLEGNHQVRSPEEKNDTDAEQEENEEEALEEVEKEGKSENIPEGTFVDGIVEEEQEKHSWEKEQEKVNEEEKEESYEESRDGKEEVGEGKGDGKEQKAEEKESEKENEEGEEEEGEGMEEEENMEEEGIEEEEDEEEDETEEEAEAEEEGVEEEEEEVGEMMEEEEEVEEEEEEEEGVEEDEEEQKSVEEEEIEEEEEAEEEEEEEAEEEEEEEAEEEEEEEEDLEEEGKEEENEEEMENKSVEESERGEEEEEEEEDEDEVKKKDSQEEGEDEHEEEEEEEEKVGRKAKGHKQQDNNKSRKLETNGKIKIPKQKVTSKQHAVNGLQHSQQFWNNVLPHYLTLK
ncbi:X-linked retinitis pigmentosa GTPase regulator isoform X1 [Anolis carolinensis]|uniref:X-linked retinitis pigmentosa GTPase regulator isoform X1 n=1 Tax=Anolis carolinensis TaxID=28377 RepID=UPI002F2B338E